MELVQEYLEEIKKIHGVWIINVPDELDQSTIMAISERWKSDYPDDKLVFLPQDIKINKYNKYSMYVAMMLIRGGYKITRLEWIIMEGSKSNAPYLVLEEIEGHDVLIKKWPGRPEDDEFFIIEVEHMDASDYVLVV